MDDLCASGPSLCLYGRLVAASGLAGRFTRGDYVAQYSAICRDDVGHIAGWFCMCQREPPLHRPRAKAPAV